MSLTLGPVLPIGLILLALGARTISPGLIAAAGALGVFAAISSLVSVASAFLLTSLTDPIIKAAAQAFLAAAVPEEAAKLIVLRTVVLRHEDAVPGRDSILVGAWLGLGFALFENFFFVTSGQDWLSTGSLRAATAVPMHVALGMIMGLFLAKPGSGCAVLAFAIPVGLHGLYDWPVFIVGDRASAATGLTSAWIGVLAVVLIVIWALLRGPVAKALRSSLTGRFAADALPEALARPLILGAAATAILLRVGAWFAILATAIAPHS